ALAGPGGSPRLGLLWLKSSLSWFPFGFLPIFGAPSHDCLPCPSPLQAPEGTLPASKNTWTTAPVVNACTTAPVVVSTSAAASRTPSPATPSPATPSPATPSPAPPSPATPSPAVGSISFDLVDLSLFISFLLGGLSRATESEKKADVVKHSGVFDHVGILVNG